jgi:pimeloyl-ACP methyl ester carboxylesterase
VGTRNLERAATIRDPEKVNGWPPPPAGKASPSAAASAEDAERQLAAIYTAPDRGPALTAITSPTTIMHGDGDKLIDPAASRELHTIIASSTLTIYPGMGHSLPRSLWPDIVAEIRHVSAHNRDHHQPGHSQPPAETRSGGPAHPR